MAVDEMRELAKQYPDLLTVECEGFDETWVDDDGRHRAGGSLCPLCGGAGRRPRTLEELLMALEERGVGRAAFTLDNYRSGYHVFVEPWDVTAPQPILEEFGNTRREAVAKLLIELEANRG